MGRFTDRIFRSQVYNSSSTDIRETNVTEVSLESLQGTILPNFSNLLHETISRDDVALPSLITVSIEDNMAFITEVEFDPTSLEEGSPGFSITGAYRDSGITYEGNVFVSDEAVMEFSEEDLLVKIAKGDIGSGTCFLARCIVSADAKFGMNCIIGQDSKVSGFMVI